MSDSDLDEALRDLFSEEHIRPELADRLVREARPRRMSVWQGLLGLALVAAVLSLAVLPAGPLFEASGSGERVVVSVPLDSVSLDEVRSSVEVALWIEEGDLLVLQEAGARQVEGGSPGTVAISIPLGQAAEIDRARAEGRLVWVAPVGQLIATGVGRYQVLQRTGPCGLERLERDPKVRRTWTLLFELYGGRLESFEMESGPSGGDSAFEACVSEAAESFVWPEGTGGRIRVPLQVGPEPAQAVDEVQVRLRVIELPGPDAVPEGLPEGVWAAIDAMDTPLGKLLAGPVLTVAWGSEAGFMAGGGGESDNIDLRLVPLRDEAGRRVRMALALPGEVPPKKGVERPLVDGENHFGLARRVGEVWYLVLIDL